MKRQHVKALIASLETGTDSQAPEWVLLFREGMNTLEDGSPFLVNRNSYDLLMAYIKSRGVDVVWDYEHQSVTSGKAPAAGWIKEYRYVEGRGIEVRVVWTEEAAGYIARGEYRYFSPVFHTRKSDHRVVGLHSVALTNTPKTNNLEPLLAKLGAEDNQTAEEETMWKLLLAKLGLSDDAGKEQALAAIVAKLGLPAESTEAQAVDAIVAKLGADSEQQLILAKAEVPGDVLGALDMEDGDISTVVASIHALKQKENTMVSREEFQRLQAKLAARDAEEVVAAAMKEGKITPDQKEWALTYAKSDLSGFKTFVAKAAVVVPLTDLPKGDGGDRQVMDDTTLQVAKMMGNTEEDLKRHGGVE